MNPIWTQIITRTILRPKNAEIPTNYSPYQLAKTYRQFRRSLRRGLRDLVLIVLGIFSAAFGFKGFLLTNHFIDGGATGISLLVSALTGWPLWLLLIVVNIPFLFLGYRVMDKAFAIKAGLAIAGLAVCLATVHFPDVTKDNLLVALFGGFFLGAGIGLTMRGGAVIDGTEVLAIYLSRKMGATIGDVVVVINVLIFSAAAYFLGVEVALYSMITYMAASKTLDFLIEGLDEYTGVTIVSQRNSEAIQQMIVTKLGRGVTVYNGKHGYGKRGRSGDVDVLYTVITRLEVHKLKAELDKIEPDVFLVMNSVKDTRGGMIKKRPLDH